jgi:hypothetical protein
MYLADERFRKNYDDLAPGLARYVHDAHTGQRQPGGGLADGITTPVPADIRPGAHRRAPDHIVWEVAEPIRGRA